MRTLAPLPDGSADNDVAGPRRCAHHPGITLGGVICGGDDASPVGRGEHREQRALPSRGADRLAGQPVVLQLASCHFALADFAAVQTLLREVEEILRRRPRLGVFVAQAEDLRVELSHARGSFTTGPSALTAAELRLLPLLPTHISFPGDRYRDVPLPEHCQVGDDVDLPEAGRVFPQPGGHPGP